MCPTSHAQHETHTNATVSCFLLPELDLPQLKLRAAPCSRTLCTSDLPSALSQKSGIREITISANKASTGFPLGKHAVEDEFCCLIDGALPHPLVMHRTIGLVYLVLPLSSILGITSRANSSSSYGQSESKTPLFPGPHLPSEFSRIGAQCCATCCMTLSHLNSSHSDTVWFAFPFQRLQQRAKELLVRGACASMTHRCDSELMPFSVP